MTKTILKCFSWAVVCLLMATNAMAGTANLADAPLVTSSASTVQPNVFLMMDDSGSMNWDFVPDWPPGTAPFSTSTFGRASNQCNGIYYNPAVTYTAPVKADGVTYYPNSSFTSAWMDGYNTSNGAVDLSSKFRLGLFNNSGAPTSGVAAYYYYYLGTQTTAAQKNYYDSSSTFFTECNTPAGSLTATITVSGSTSTSVTGITVNGVQIMNAASTASSSSSTVATNIASKITLGGYSATASGSTVTIAGPSTAATYTPVIVKSGSMALTPSAFSPFAKIIVSATSGPGGTDERTNFANWFSYYRTRVNMMKTGSGLAFRALDTHYRVGFATMNNNSGTDLVNLATFDSTQKTAWYDKLYKVTVGSSTPLLGALSRAGLMYAHKLPGNTLNTVTANDPMQYACQQNFTILSTDGFWNDQSNSDLKGSMVGNVDGAYPRPYNDGGATVVTNKTPTVTTTVTTTPRTVVSGKDRTDRTTTPSTHSRTDTYTRTQVTTSTAGCSGTKKKVTTTTYSGTNTETQAFSSYSDQLFRQLTTTVNADTSTVVSTSTHTVVTTNGVVTSDTTAVSNTAPSNSSSVTSTSAAAATAIGSPTTSTGGAAASTYSPAKTVAAISWGSPTSSSTTSCQSSGSASDTLALSSSGAWGATTATGSASTSTGSWSTSPSPYPTTSNGTASSAVTGPTTGATTTTTIVTGGVPNTLSDVAMYYYATDLRDSGLSNCTGALGAGVDVCANIVPSSAQDTASWQHMTTFTLGLGAFGRMVFSPSYATDTSGDYFSVKNGTLANPGGGVCSWGTNGQPCNWPTPDVSGTPENIDDLWHAAVNARGAYFSATDPTALSSGLTNALSGIAARTGSSAAATTSNPNVTSGDNFVFSSTFDTAIWDGELVRQQLDLTSGALSSTIDWSAQGQFDASAAARNIYTYDPTNATAHAKPFLWANLTTTEQNYFNSSNISTLSQFCSSGVTCLSAASQTAAAGSNLVSFLRGDRSNEGASTDTSKYYRQRSTTATPHPNAVLGDIVNAEAVYVKGSLYTYADSLYSNFITNNSTRTGMVYAASNDGMLHAFNAGTGAEVWAYMPSFVLPNLYKLADKNYANLHQYFVDGTPVVGDVYFGGAWHTILVGGLNKGGRGYYALDVTNPSSTPTVLWEFSDANLGYSYGNPVITKLSNGTWAVLVGSGYNNVSPGDGQGRLFVLYAEPGAGGTAQVVRSIPTGVGDATTPSGLTKISAWVDNPMVNNTALRAYGGDLQGNLWRFDINAGTKQLLVTLKDSSGNPQPITVKPELGEVGNTAMVFVGTGRYLGNPDLSDISKQSFYGIKDKLDASTYASSRTGFIRQTETTSTCPAGTPATICTTGQTVRITSTTNAVNLASDNGWYTDLPDSGERADTDPTLGLGTIAFTTNVPNATACTAGGYSYRYFLDYATGAPVSTAGTVVGVKLGNALGTRPVLVHLPNNTIIELTRLSDGTTVSSNVPIGNAAANTRRVSWREIVN